MELCAGESCCKFRDIPEEQHTGGIVEVLGRVIVVACLWRKQVHELQDREVARRRRLNVVTRLIASRESDSTEITCCISNTISLGITSEKRELHDFHL